jgi:hypothetical protein
MTRWLIGAAALSLSVAAWGAVWSEPARAGPADFAKSLVPGYPDVVAEYVQIPGFAAQATPRALNTAAFLRLRAAADGEKPRPANAVIVAMPGFSSTPPHWLWLASQLVHKTAGRTCADGQPCRLEVWVVERRGANLADMAGAREARRTGDPNAALDYYFGPGAVKPDPARGGAPTVVALPGGTGATFHPLSEGDLAFMADWGLEAYAGDVDAMIALIRQASGAHNIFLAGHSQGGGFVSSYAGRLQADGARGAQKLAGLIFLDGGPSAGGPAPASDADIKGYLDHVADLRSGKAKVYTGGEGPLGAIAGPMGGATVAALGSYFALGRADRESIFPMAAPADPPTAGSAFRYAIRLTLLAQAGASIDVDPLPGADLQTPFLRALGEGLGRLDFRPLRGTESRCDPAPAAQMFGFGPPAAKPPTGGFGPPPPFVCAPTPAMLDPTKVYGWLEGGGGGVVAGKVGKARLWMTSEGFAPARSNVRPVTLTFAQSGPRTIDASIMAANNFYPSERYDYDSQFFGRFRSIRIAANGVALDIDKAAIANVAVYVARRSSSPQADNPFPGVTDYTEINRTGAHQSAAAKAIGAIDPLINVALYNHTDIVSADDSLAGQVRPGEPGASAIADTLVDWVLERSEGRAATPTPRALSVVDVF